MIIRGNWPKLWQANEQTRGHTYAWEKIEYMLVVSHKAEWWNNWWNGARDSILRQQAGNHPQKNICLTTSISLVFLFTFNWIFKRKKMKFNFQLLSSSNALRMIQIGALLFMMLGSTAVLIVEASSALCTAIGCRLLPSVSVNCCGHYYHCCFEYQRWMQAIVAAEVNLELLSSLVGGGGGSSLRLPQPMPFVPFS